MKYFSGFCFHDEQDLFGEWIEDNDFCVAGFSYGTIKAFEYVLSCDERIDKLQLFSPAFFQDKDRKFKKLQILSFRKDKDKYIEEFVSNSVYPSNIDLTEYIRLEGIEALSELLDYIWDSGKLETLTKQGTKIEVYLGAQDKIIDPDKVLDFFLPYADVYYMKEVGHILR